MVNIQKVFLNLPASYFSPQGRGCPAFCPMCRRDREWHRFFGSFHSKGERRGKGFGITHGAGALLLENYRIPFALRQSGHHLFSHDIVILGGLIQIVSALGAGGDGVVLFQCFLQKGQENGLGHIVAKGIGITDKKNVHGEFPFFVILSQHPDRNLDCIGNIA